MPDISRINNTMGKMALYLGNHNSICISVSGGSDSDIIVHMVATYFREFLPKIHFVFANTGLEYRATLRHLDYLEKRYGIRIDRVRGMSVVTAVRKYGTPVISKNHSDKIRSFCNGARCATDRVYGLTKSKMNFSKHQRELAIAIKQRGILVSSYCCNKSKKKPVYDFLKSVHCDLTITGERKAEGGVRSTSNTSCFKKIHSHGWDKYMPLFFWDDETKQHYKESEGIVYSDCYEVWGMKRTGCVGCPYNSRAGEDLRKVKQYEPNLFKACMSVFGEAYRLQDEFHINRHPILEGLDDEDAPDA